MTRGALVPRPERADVAAPMRFGHATPLLLACALGACTPSEVVPYAYAPPVPPAPADLPAAVFLKTKTESFTHDWYIALREGRVWIKPNPESSDRRGPWRHLPPDGFVHHELRDPNGSPPEVREISADGENLVAIGDDGLVYVAKLYDFHWNSWWGFPPPFRDALYVTGPHAGLAVSHRAGRAAWYEDIDGNRHSFTVGVTTLAVLSTDRATLSYADPWLPARFDRRICLPRAGRFRPAGFASSASTSFVIDEAGEAWTRLADYDTLGDDPLLAYTWERGARPPGGGRTLPAEDWVREPPLPGMATARITILQTGEGNAARELRVEGVDVSGRGGYWAKALRATAWTFVHTGAPVVGPFVRNGANPPALRPETLLGPVRARDLAGTIERPALGGGPGGGVSLVAFDPECSPARLRVGDGPAWVDLPLHWRAPERDESGRIVAAAGAILVPAPATGEVAGLLARLLGDAPFVEVELELGADGSVIVTGDAPGLFRRLRLVFQPR